MSGDRFAEHYRLLSTDPQMRAELLADPKAALAAYFGAVVEGEYRVEVIEKRPDTITAVIPTPPGPGVDRPRAWPRCPGEATTCCTRAGSAAISSQVRRSPGCSVTCARSGRAVAARPPAPPTMADGADHDENRAFTVLVS